jgi:hypothetical protein
MSCWLGSPARPQALKLAMCQCVMCCLPWSTKWVFGWSVCAFSAALQYRIHAWCSVHSTVCSRGLCGLLCVVSRWSLLTPLLWQYQAELGQ